MNNIPDMSQGCVEKPELVEEVLAELTSFERSCLLLSLNEGFTISEIAEVLNKKQKSVERALQRANEHFRRIHLASCPHGASRAEGYEKHLPDQQREADFVEICIQAVPGPGHSIELPPYVQQQWKTQDCIENDQEMAAATFPIMSSAANSSFAERNLPLDERAKAQEGYATVFMRAETKNENSLQQMDSYIREQVRQKVQKYSISEEIADLEMDELAQQVRIKLWLALQKKTISSPKAYIRCIVNNELTSFIRQKKRQLQFVGIVDEEIAYNNLFLYSCENTSDPVVEIEQKETEGELLKQIVEVVLSLPFLQKTAFLCFLHERVDDPTVLNRALQRAENTGMLSYRWPEDWEARQKLVVSCNMARFRVAQSLGIDLKCYKRRR